LARLSENIDENFMEKFSKTLALLFFMCYSVVKVEIRRL